MSRRSRAMRSSATRIAACSLPRCARERVSGTCCIEPLGKHLDRTTFHCGSDAIDRYLEQQTRQAEEKYSAAAFVLLVSAGAEVSLLRDSGRSGARLEYPDPTRSGQSALQVDVSKAGGPVRRASDFATGLAGNEITTARRPKDSVVGHVRVCSHRYHGSQPSARVAGLLPQ